MKIHAILVDAKPKNADECPFSYGDWSHYCCMGGRCSLEYGNDCSRLYAPFEVGDDPYSKYDEED